MKEKSILLTIFFTGAVLLCSCQSSTVEGGAPAEKKQPVMTASERAEYEAMRAEQAAKRQEKEKRKNKGSSRKGGYKRHSEEKRRQYGNVEESILLDPDKRQKSDNILPWKKSGSRSDKLHEEQMKNREQSGIK